MKRFSEFMESCTTADLNQGNDVTLGVTNHLTPVQNIVTNVRNLFPNTYIVASVGEDGVSVKLNSSRFINKEETTKYLYEPVWQNNSVASYIQSQGLDAIKMINLGMYFVVYFYPSDVKFTAPGEDLKKPEVKDLTADNDKDKKKETKKEDKKEAKKAPVKEQYLEEAEMDTIVTESDDDEELKDLTKEKINELIQSKDKVKAAKQIELLVGQEIELPRDYYFAGVKDKQGNESVALRWKYTVKRPKGMTAEATRSLLNIYDLTEDGIWVADFDEDSMFQLPDEVKTLIENILEFLGAEKTDDPCVWSLAGKKEDEKKNDDEEAKNEEKPEENKGADEEDSEDEKSRGEENDLL